MPQMTLKWTKKRMTRSHIPLKFRNHNMKIPPQEEDDFQNAEEELELDQSSELYKTIVAAIINEEDDGDIEDDGFDKLEESAPARDTKGKTGPATVIKRL